VDQSTYEPGDVVEVTYEVTNSGADSLGGAVSVNDVPDALSLQGNDTVFLGILDHPAPAHGESVTVTFRFKIDEDATAGEYAFPAEAKLQTGDIKKTATTQTTVTVANKSESSETAAVDVTIDAPEEAAPGDTIEVETTVMNTGELDAGGGSVELQPKSPLSVSEEPIQFIGVYEEPPTAGDAVSKSFNVTVPQDMTAETVELQANATLMTYDKTTVSQSEKTTLSIESADAIPMLPNQTAVPTDPDNDSQYEDLTGDGVVTREDLRVFQDHLTSSAVQSHPDAFDYSGDGTVNESDTQELYTEFVTPDDGEVTERVVITSIVDHLTDRVAPGLPNEQTITDLLVEYKNES
jgi:uncharacterized membrane protein